MTRAKNVKNNAQGPTSILEDWLRRLNELTTSVTRWAEELGWSTKIVSKKMSDSRLGRYEAPALIMQKETVRVLLDPVARFAPGTEGIVDLYLMPGYDDIATLYIIDGQWRLHHMFFGNHASTCNDLEHEPLAKETLARLIDEMAAHAPKPL